MTSRLSRRRFIALAALSPLAISACGRAQAPAAGPGRPPGGKATLKVGVIGPKAGPYGSLVDAQTRGIQLAVDEINRQGINGTTIELVVRESGTGRDSAVAALTGLIETDRCVAVVGAAMAESGDALTATANRLKTPLIIALGSGKRLLDDPTAAASFVFRNALADDVVTESMVTHALQSIYSKPAIFADTSQLGQWGAEGILRNTTQAGLSVATYQPYPSGLQDAAPLVKAAKDSGADSIFLYGRPTDAVAVRRAMQKASMLDVPTIAGWTCCAPEFVTDARDVAEGTVLPSSFVVTETPKVRDFVDRFSKKFNTAGRLDAPSAVAQAYDSTYLLAQALQRASGGGDDLRQALESLSTFDGIAKLYNAPWSPTQHEGLTSQDVVVTQVRDGVLVHL